MDGEKIKIEVEIPVGYDLVINGTDCKLVPKSRLPKTWEEFCEVHPIQNGECFIGECAKIHEVEEHRRNKNIDKNFLPNKETAEAFLALMQLIQLRNCYNGDWEPDWTNELETKYTITFYYNLYCDRDGGVVEAVPDLECVIPRVLTFKSEELRDQFLENFKDLIEIAKPLI